MTVPVVVVGVRGARGNIRDDVTVVTIGFVVIAIDVAVPVIDVGCWCRVLLR